MKSLQHYIKYSFAAFFLMVVLFFPPLNNSALSQQSLKLTKDEAKDMANYIVHLYRSNILNFTKKYKKYYLNETPEKLESLFQNEVLNSLSIVDLPNWKLPRFIFSGNKNFVVNKHHLPDISDEQIKYEIKNSGKSIQCIEKDLRRYEFTLTKEIKDECIKVLRKESFYIREVGNNFIIGINLIPNEINRVRKIFNDDKIKTKCVQCHTRITTNKKEMYVEDTDLLEYNYKNNDLGELNGAFVFEIPIK